MAIKLLTLLSGNMPRDYIPTSPKKNPRVPGFIFKIIRLRVYARILRTRHVLVLSPQVDKTVFHTDE